MTQFKFGPLPRVTTVRFSLTIPSDVHDEFLRYVQAIQENFPALTINPSEIMQQMVTEAMASDRTFQNWKRRQQSGSSAFSSSLGENTSAEVQPS